MHFNDGLSFPGACCNNVEISSTGEARRDQTLYMGVYTRLYEDYNGRPVYVKEGRDELYVYKIGLLLCHSHIELRLELRLSN